jgi:hypothetical protein
MHSRIYSRFNVDLERLSIIQARKSSIIKKIIGTRKNVEIAIRGKPSKFH